MSASGVPRGEAARSRAASTPAWKALLAAEPEAQGTSVQRHPARIDAPPSLPSAPTSMGLQFELREQLPRTSERWRGPTAQSVTSVKPGHGEFRLGVRPVLRRDTGNWVRAGLAWNNLTFQVRELNLDPAQHRWFSEFVAVYRAVRLVYSNQETDWIYLDQFTSPLLWHFLDEAAVLGIELVGVGKQTTVAVARTAAVSLDVTQAGRGVRLTTRLTIDDTALRPDECGTIGTHGLYSYSFTPKASFVLAPTAQPLTNEQSRLIGRAASALIPAPDVPEFLTEFYPVLRRSLQIESTDASVTFPEATPPALVLTAHFSASHTLRLTGRIEYREGSQVTLLALHSAPGESFVRDDAAEAELRGAVDALLNPESAAPPATATSAASTVPAVPAAPPVPPVPPVPLALLAVGITRRGIDAAEFTDKVLSKLRRLPGVRVDVVGTEPDYRELTATPRLTVTIVETDQRDWFDLGVLVSVDGKSVPFAPLFAALAKGRTRLLLVDNSYLSLTQPIFERLHELIQEAQALKEWDTGLRISRFQASLWADFEDLADQSEPAVSWRDAVAGLLDVAGIETTPLPVGVHATLRPYQQRGFDWLAFLWKHQLGAILADDMGLGKTLQALALIEHAVDQPPETPDTTADRRPFLVVAPTSVVSNWVAEAARFTPRLRVRALTTTEAAGRTTLADAAAGADVIVTSYALFRLDFDAYQEHGWAGLILDEAQFVKNSSSQAHICARDLRTPFKLAITGTPLENSLLDLWSLLTIVAPGLYPSARRFTEEYVRPIARGDRPELFARLRRRIRPLMLRRSKEIVATELPPKQEQVLKIELNPAHRALYDTFLQRERQKLLGLLEDIDTNRFIIFRSITLLRLLSLDPSLVDPAYAHVASSKLDALFEHLDDVVAEGHRALIFSQFTSFLRLAAARLDAAGTPYCYLDGSTLRRSDVIDRFKTGQAPVFLISLKAGGFGLTLTEADYVFLLDPWWNPATEAQAVDRTHRIGQTRSVMVYRLVATDTIEEKVMALQQKKAELFDSVMNDDTSAFSESLTAADIRALLD